jgi:hypothetical protein
MAELLLLFKEKSYFWQKLEKIKPTYSYFYVIFILSLFNITQAWGSEDEKVTFAKA